MKFICWKSCKLSLSKKSKRKKLFWYKYDDEEFHQVEFKIFISARQKQKKKKNDAYKSIGSVLGYLLSLYRKKLLQIKAVFSKTWKLSNLI